MALCPEDKKELKGMLEDSVGLLAQGIVNTIAPLVTSMHSEVSSTKTAVTNIERTVQGQAQRCDRISKELYDRTNQHENKIIRIEDAAVTRSERIKDNAGIAKKAMKCVKAMNAKVWAALIFIVVGVISFAGWLIQELLRGR